MFFISVATERLTGMCLGKGISEQREGGTALQTWNFNRCAQGDRATIGRSILT